MSKKILIVDDEKDITDYFSQLLQDNGFTTVTADNGKAAFELLKTDKPDLVCLDITMPEESGVRFYRNLNDSIEFNEIPVVIVTGISSDFKKFIETRKQVPPPAAYFEKPINQIEFIDKIKAILG